MSETCPQPGAILGWQMHGETMGTTWSAAYVSAPGLAPEDVRAALEAVFERIIRSMSPWEPTSCISAFNQLRQAGHLVADPDFMAVLTMALDIARRSGGAFDPCLGGEVLRRGFGPVALGIGRQGARHGPDAWGALIMPDRTLRQPGGVTLDFNAIAKGYAVDCMGATLEAFGVRQYLVEIGGEFLGRGVKPDRSPWWVDLELPQAEGSRWRAALCGLALATSGDYRQMRGEGTARVCHIVPATGRGPADTSLASVSVLHKSCALADAWATALFALGGAAGRQLAEAEGLAALFQYRGKPAEVSSGLVAYLA